MTDNLVKTRTFIYSIYVPYSAIQICKKQLLLDLKKLGGRMCLGILKYTQARALTLSLL